MSIMFILTTNIIATKPKIHNVSIINVDLLLAISDHVNIITSSYVNTIIDNITI